MGALSALPALDVKQQQTPDLLEKYAQLQALRGQQQQMQQRAALAPLQQQEAQQSLTQGGLQIQQQQQALKDQQAVTAAMQQWDGKDLNGLAPLVLKNGGSGQAVIGLKQKQLEIESKAADTFKAQQDGGKAQVEQIKQRNDMLAGAFSPLTDPTKVADAQLPQALAATVQSLTSQGTLTPQDAQAAGQLGQSGDPNAIRAGLKEFINSHQALSQTIENAQKQASTAKEQADAKLAQMNAERGGTTDVDKFESDWLKSNSLADTPANRLKAFQEYTKETKIAPAQVRAQTFLQMPQAVFNPETGQNEFTTRAKSIGQVAPSSAEALAAKGSVQADVGSLKNLQKNFDQVSAFENTANKNLDLFLNKLSAIPDLGSKFGNVPMRMIDQNMIGSANYQAMKAAQQTAAAETAKVLSSANASGVLSDTQKKEAEEMLSGNLSYKAAQKVVETLKQDFANRHQSYQSQIGQIQGRLKQGGGNAAPETTAPASVVRYKIVNGQLVAQ